MKSKKSYNKILVLFFIVIALVLMTGCDGGVGFGSIEVNSTPSGARVYLDGADTGQVTPIVLNASAGDHTVKLSKYHYKDWADVVTVIAEQTTYLNPPLIWAPDETITIQPGSIDGKDAYVDNNYPTYCYGNAKSLYVGAGCSDAVANVYEISRIYLQFDLSSVPPYAVIISADLGLCKCGLYVGCSNSGCSTPKKLSVGVYEVTESWEKDTITWNNQPASSNEAENIKILEGIPLDDFVYWDIADLVKGWCGGSISGGYIALLLNHGIILRATDETPPLHITHNGRYFYSSVWGEEIYHPKLVIDYYIP